MRIVFWQNMLAIHQSAHIRALAADAGNEVTLVVPEAVGAERLNLGWVVPDFGRATVIVDPSKAVMDALIHDRPGESTHIFSAIHAFPMVEKAFFRCLPTQAKIGLLVECQDFRGWLGLVRLGRARVDALRYARRISVILAMGEMGVQWFRRCGFSRACVFPYGYFVEKPALPLVRPNPGAAADPGTDVRLMYLGQLIPRKGVDTLLRALGQLADQDWSLTIMGSGPMQTRLERRAERLQIRDRVMFLPVQSNADAVAQIARHDLLVLPSRFDGWGAVVNEALMCGVPVICSDHCGAAELLEESWRGEVFAAGSVSSLQNALRRRIARGRRTPDEAERLQNWSRCIEGEAAAAYLLQALRSATAPAPCPLPPWRSADGIAHGASGLSDELI